MEGWIKLYRKLAEKAYYNKDSEKVHLWIHLLIKATHEGREEYLGGKPFLCKPGQFTTGRHQLAKETGINRSKVERILEYFDKIEHQIEQQKTNTNRLISIINWKDYQNTEHQIEQQVSNDRTTSEQQVSTLKECKNEKNVKKIKEPKVFKIPKIEDVKTYFIENGYPETLAIRFFNYYEAGEWTYTNRDGKVVKVKNWKQKVQSSWFNEKDKIEVKQKTQPIDYKQEMMK
jgi:hypothetical protein